MLARITRLFPLWAVLVSIAAYSAPSSVTGIAPHVTMLLTIIMLSMGGGTGGDAQYLFSEDVLGYTRVHRPRHAKVYRNFRAELDRLQRERAAAFAEFKRDVETGVYPAPEHLVPIADAEFDAFVKQLPG